MTNLTMISELRFAKCVAQTGDMLTVSPGQFYQILPDPAEEDGMLRIIDNTGEDYLYDADMFEIVADLSGLSTELTISLSIPAKATIFQLASRRGMSMAAFIRELLDERLDLPINVSG
ncbi:MAG: ribbon-helix-helix domain-containing protein [Caldilineaceae bacterium]